MVFTGTGPLLNSLQRLGLEYSVLGHADDSSLDEGLSESSGKLLSVSAARRCCPAD